MENDVTKYRQQVEAYLEATVDSRAIIERDVDYRHLRQWSDEEIKVLKARGQPVVTFDYIGEQVDYLVGMEVTSRQDPRAFPRTREHEDATDAATDALRYVADESGFIQTASRCYEDILVAGTESAIVEVEKEGDDYKIKVRRVPWDRFYYDPHSRDPDFQDATYMGIAVWLDEDEIVRLYGAKARAADGKFTTLGAGLEDSPRGWCDEKRNRRRVCQHYYLKDGVWYVCHFSGDTVLLDSKPVSYVDEDGTPVNPLVAQSAYVDRDGNRYGYVRKLIDPQNEVNHRRSKGLHILNNRQVISEEGAVKDRAAAKRELRKPDGWVEVLPGALREGRIQVNTGADMAPGQMSMYADAVGKLQASGANAAMQGDMEIAASGAAIGRLQRGGSVQTARLKDLHKDWKVRIYKQIWLRVRQFWDAPMWVRVTDDENNLKWVGLNQPVTVGMEMLEAAKAGDQQAAEMLRAAIAENDPQLMQQIQGPGAVRNPVASMGVDIIIDESPDTMNVQEDQFRTLAELAKVYGPQAVPFTALIEMSAMPQKRRVLEMLKPQNDPVAAQLQTMQSQLVQMQAQASLQESQAKAAKTAADARQSNAKAEQIEMETQLVRSLPDLTPNVNI